MVIGEIRKGNQVGRKDNHKVTWIACVDCGKERWVVLRNGKPENQRCSMCVGKFRGEVRTNNHRAAIKAAASYRATGERNPMFGRHHSEETKQKIRLVHKGKELINARGPRPLIAREKNPNWRGGQIIHCDNCGAEIGWRRPYRILGQQHHFCNAKCMGKWQSQSSEFLSLVVKGNRMKPNKKEIALQEMVNQLNLPYQYVGDGQFILGGRCPDFLNTNGQKKLIELFGTHWHDSKYFPNRGDSQERIDYFAQYGFDTLVIWEKELKNPDDLKDKLVKFDAKRVGLS